MTSINTLDLTGRNLGERQRNLNHLVNRASDDLLDPERLVNLHYKPLIEQVFIGKIADCKKNPRVLCELLKSEQPIVVHTVLHANWLFKGTTHQDFSNAKYFEEQVFPFVSYHARCRIIATFGAYLKNHRTAEDFYKLVNSLYGWKLAIKLLSACSVDFIKLQMHTFPLEIPCGPLFKIYQRNRQSVIVYLNKYYERKFIAKSKILKFINYDKILKKLAWDEPRYFLALLKHYPFASRSKEFISKRTTKHLLRKLSDKVIEYSKHLQYTINNKTVAKYLKNELLENYLLNTFPNDYNEFPFTLTLNSLKGKQKALMLYKLHPIKYNGVSILERDYLTPYEIKYIPKEERIKWVEEKLTTLNYEEQKPYFKYLEPRIASNRLKTINANAEQTFHLLKELSECHVINNDEKGLILTITKTTCIMKKPQHLEQGIAFLNRIRKLYDVKKVSVELWLAICQFVDTVSKNEAISSDQLITLILYHVDDLRFHLKHNLNYNPIMYKMLEIYSLNDLQSFIMDTTVEINLLEKKATFVKNSVVLIRNKMLMNFNYQEAWQSLLFIVKLYNEVNKSLSVSFADWKWLLLVIDKGTKYWTKDKTNIIMTEINKHSKMRSIFFKHIFLYSLDSSILDWILRYDIDTIIKHINKLLKYFTDDSIPLLTNNRPIQLSNYALSSWLRYDLCSWNGVVFTKKPWLDVGTIRCFSQRIKFFNKITVYFFNTLRPILFKIISDNIEMNSLTKEHALQIVIGTWLINSEDCKRFLDLKFKQVTIKDFLNTIKRGMRFINSSITYGMIMRFIENGNCDLLELAIMSIISKKSMKDTKDFIEDLIKESVIVKKIGLNLAFNVYSKNDLLILLTNIWNQTANSQIKRIVFNKTIKLLHNEVREQNNYEIWKNIKYFMGSFTDMDVKLLKYIKLSDKMASKTWMIFNEYCEVTWKFLKELEMKNIDVSLYKTSLTKSMVDNLNCVSEKFLEIFVVDYWNGVETLNTLDVKETLPFVIVYMSQNFRGQVTDLDLRSGYICTMIKKNFTKYSWNVQENGVHLFKEYLNDLIFKFFKHAIKMNNGKSLMIFTIQFTRIIWHSLPAENDNFKYMLQIFIYFGKTFVNLRNAKEFKTEFNDQIILNGYSDKLNKLFGKKLLQFYKWLISRHNNIQDVFFDTLKQWITLITEDETENVSQDITMSIIDGLDINAFPDISTFNLTNILPGTLYKGSKYKGLHDNLTTFLFSIDNGVMISQVHQALCDVLNTAP